MVQRQWSYLDVTGQNYQIGLYHGLESGNFVIYINNKIMVIDFKIFEEKSYSFMLGNELIRIDLKKMEDESFDYQLHNDAVWMKSEPWEATRDQFIIWALVFLGLTVLFTIAYFIFA